MSAIKIVRKVFPEAQNALFCGECDNCHSESLIFFQLPFDMGQRLEGGFYCPDCSFSNAGKLALVAPNSWPSSRRIAGPRRAE